MDAALDPVRARAGGYRSPLNALRRVHPRTRRVALLIVAIMIMSVGDLMLTLTYLRHLGMAESNPLARLVIDFRSPALLVVWKMATVIACVSILLWKSRSRSAEIGAWAGTLILAALMLHWSSYVKIAPPVLCVWPMAVLLTNEHPSASILPHIQV